MRSSVGKKAGTSLAVLVIVAAVLGAVDVALAWGGCAYYGFQTNRDTRYAAIVGCMVKVKDDWIPRNELRVVQ